MTIAVVGTGYVGLVTGACLAEIGHDVMCVDNNFEKIEALKQLKIPIYEPGISEIVSKNTQSKKLQFTSQLEQAVQKSQVIFLCLPTPSRRDGSANLDYVYGVAKEIGPFLQEDSIIVNKSTVPVGTAQIVRKIISEHTSVNFEVVSNPEFLREGSAVNDFFSPDRIVIGTESDEAFKVMASIYSYFEGKTAILKMDTQSAEITKYAANAFLATKISFINEIASICEKVGANILDVAQGIGSDHRIGNHFLQAGIGYGGSCFPKDVSALVYTGQQLNYKMSILYAVDKVNAKQKAQFIKKISARFGYNLKGITLAIWGISFKANTDDIRESPAVEIIQRLYELGANLQVYDPKSMENFQKQFRLGITFAKNQYDALTGAQGLVVLTEWEEFKQADFARVKTQLQSYNLFDARNIFPKQKMLDLGFDYWGVGV